MIIHKGGKGESLGSKLVYVLFCESWSRESNVDVFPITLWFVAKDLVNPCCVHVITVLFKIIVKYLFREGSFNMTRGGG